MTVEEEVDKGEEEDKTDEGKDEVREGEIKKGGGIKMHRGVAGAGEREGQEGIG